MRGLVAAGLLALSALHLSCLRRVPDVPPEPPTGPRNGYVRHVYKYSAVASSAEGHPAGFRLSWGDGDTSDWTDFASPGETLRLAHAWAEPGFYDVAAQSRSSVSSQTDWSQPLTVSIGIRPGPPEGPVLGFVDSLTIFVAASQVGSGHPVSFRFSWGDGDTSPWSNLTPYGDSCQVSHAWSEAGSYEVRVRARDSVGNCTEWSFPLSVQVRPFLVGTVKWRFSIPPGYRPSPAIGQDGTVYLASVDCLLWALRPDGRVEWAARLPGRPLSAPAIGHDGAVRIDTEEGVVAVTGAGRVSWLFPRAHLRGPFRKDLAIGEDGTVYCSIEDSLVAVNRYGAHKWAVRLPSGGSMLGPIVGPGEQVIVTDYGYGVHAYRPDGTLAWELGLASLGQCCADADGTIYVPVEPWRVYAVSPRGETLWFYESAWHGFDAQPAVGPDGTVYAASWVCGDKGTGRLHAIAPDGSAKWVTPSHWSGSHSTPALAADGTIYVAGNDSLLALDSHGQRLWVCPVGELREDQSPVIAPDGTIYLGETESLVAVCGASPPADSPWPMYQHDAQHTGRAGKP